MPLTLLRKVFNALDVGAFFYGIRQYFGKINTRLWLQMFTNYRSVSPSSVVFCLRRFSFYHHKFMSRLLFREHLDI